ncbi:hypothetical protein ES319_D06G040600v1 [Gossypium barbadense]|uniref:Uncharacterized protein n=3 Tax=Gossypium TaxID=3633 RepID=A0A0D2SMD0_GOSRA|nr:hypothetical protein ES319_D06G040600v1 [Gossypium barbadense]KJB64288.1 hypothetical protein B456_010G040700 [Gossypium raimondii]TYG63606.1 hypothetical protein ES288_D06G043300v1 [Gossypium darwinii]
MKSLTLLAPLLLCGTLPCSSLNVASDSAAAAALAILKWKASLQSQNHSVLLYFVYLLFKVIIVLINIGIFTCGIHHRQKDIILLNLHLPIGNDLALIF